MLDLFFIFLNFLVGLRVLVENRRSSFFGVNVGGVDLQIHHDYRAVILCIIRQIEGLYVLVWILEVRQVQIALPDRNQLST